MQLSLMCKETVTIQMNLITCNNHLRFTEQTTV